MTHTKWIQILIDTFTQETGHKQTPYDIPMLTHTTVHEATHPRFEAWLAKKPVDSIINLYNLSK